MTSLRRGEQRVQKSIGVRMRVATVASAKRRLNTPGRVMPATPAALFLVTRGMNLAPQATGTEIFVERRKQQGPSEPLPDGVLQFPTPRRRADDKKLFGFVTGLGRRFGIVS